MRLATVLVAALFACSSASALAADPTPPAAPAPAATWSPASATTATGIPLDAPWKKTIYAFAREHFHHPAWGWQHSERDYLLAMEFAKDDGIAVDPDVVFAAAMMHDMAAFAPWDAEMKGPPILRDAGFPMQKIAAVQAAESGHMFYSDAKLPEAIVLHDADSVDFLGDIGIARIIATVGEGKPSMNGALATLQSFISRIPPRLITKAAQRAAVPRIAEMNAFMERMKAESAVQ
jgi:uncharacterized protein